MNFRNNYSKFGSRKKLRIAVGIIGVLIVLFLASRVFVLVRGDSSNSSGNQDFSKRSMDANREFTFPIKDSGEKEVSKIKFVVEKIETLDEIVVKGQKAKAVPGRMFLIANIKIVNDYNKSIEINTRDYIRLSVNKNESELLAPDIHNDPVEVQAISTKYTRIGFPVNVDDHDFVLQIGEINGDKQKVELTLQ